MLPLDLNLWTEALNTIQQELPTQAYETWFQPTRAVRTTQTALIVEVPNPFFRDWLQSHYTEVIVRTLKNLTGASIEIEYASAAQARIKVAQVFFNSLLRRSDTNRE